MKKILSKKGFTLVELLVVMAIIAVLALLIIGAIIVARRTSIETVNRSNARNIQTCLEGKYAKDKTYGLSSNYTTYALAGTGLTCTIAAGGSLTGGTVTTTASGNGYTITVNSYADAAMTSEIVKGGDAP